LDTRVQEVKKSTRERLAVEHYMEIDQADGTEDIEGVHMFPLKSATTRDAISDPKEGQLIVRNESGARSIDVYNGSAWIEYYSWTSGDMKMAAYDDAAAVGWVKADGASYLRTGIYEDLFGAIGVTFGNADATHFNVPKMDGRIPIGIDSGDGDYDALNKQDGAKVKTILEANLPEHVHDEGDLVTDDPGDHGHDLEWTNTESGDSGAMKRPRNPESSPVYETDAIQAAGAHTHAITGDTGVGDGTSDNFDVMNPVITMQWYIKL
jgi:microcystin-dependent protein